MSRSSKVDYPDHGFYFDEYEFRSKVDKALIRVRQILGTTRDPQYPAEVQHQYDDKYGLAEFLTNTSAASLLHCLEVLGLTQEHLSTLLKWKSKDQTITIRFAAQEKCTYLREEKRKEESATQHVTTSESTLFGKSTRTDKVVTTITEYFWAYEWDWQIYVYGGVDTSDSNNRIRLAQRQSKYELMTTTKTTPRPVQTIISPIDIDITFLLTQINPDHQLLFRIKRDVDTCRTPRRNADIDRVFAFFNQFNSWCERVHSYINSIFYLQVKHGFDLNAINSLSLFVPVIPLFEIPNQHNSAASSSSSSSSSSSKEVSASNSGVILRLGDVNNFLGEEKRSIAQKLDELSKVLPDTNRGALISIVEATVMLMTLHIRDIIFLYTNAVNYIENMLTQQLIAAIGKEVTALDFNNYMRYHYTKIYKSLYLPKPFCYAIRRPDHYPEGTISIEAQLSAGGMTEPVNTCVRSMYTGVHTMNFNINAATRIYFTGERHLHAFIGQSFAGETQSQLSLVARARQFSSFMMIVGRIGGPTTFEPKSAIIIQNKDDLKIPLLLETLPTPKEFKDAIASLSPEQRRFAQAYRSMQLEGSLFGILIIQLKPQLEKLLNLPDDSLTKEIKLTQELLELFIKYQIPSDLLTFSGDMTASKETKLNAVREYVKKMYEMIDKCKEKVLDDSAARAQLRVYDSVPAPSARTFGGAMNRLSSPPSSHSSFPAMAMPMAPMAIMKCAAPMSMSMAPPPVAASSVSFAAFDAAPPAGATAGGGGGGATRQLNQPATTTPQPHKGKDERSSSSVSSEDGNVIDYTRIPGQLDQQFEALDEDSALRATIITAGPTWTRTSQANILADPHTEALVAQQQKEEHNKAFDLLDALSRSGALSIECASLHVVLAATHSFDKSLMDTIIQDNVNPIEKLERSSLIISATIQNQSAKELLLPEQQQRVETYSPKLFLQ